MSVIYQGDDEPIEAREAWQAEAADHNPWPCNDWRHG